MVGGVVRSVTVGSVSAAGCTVRILGTLGAVVWYRVLQNYSFVRNFRDQLKKVCFNILLHFQSQPHKRRPAVKVRYYSASAVTVCRFELRYQFNKYRKCPKTTFFHCFIKHAPKIDAILAVYYEIWAHTKKWRLNARILEQALQSYIPIAMSGSVLTKWDSQSKLQNIHINNQKEERTDILWRFEIVWMWFFLDMLKRLIGRQTKIWLAGTTIKEKSLRK